MKKFYPFKRSLILSGLFTCFFAFSQSVAFNGFESGLGWTSVEVGSSTGASYGWKQAASVNSTSITTQPILGTYLAAFNTQASGQKHELQSPAIMFSGQHYAFSFDVYRTSGNNNYTKLNVYYNTVSGSTGGTLIGTISAIRYTESPAETPDVGSGWHRYSFDIPGNPSGAGYITIEGISNGNGITAAIDNVAIVQSSASCGSVPAFPYKNISNVAYNSAQVSLTPPSPAPANGYEYYVSTSYDAMNTVTTATGSASSAPFTVSNLLPETTYYIWVRSKCSSSDPGRWSDFRTFKTKCAPGNIPFTEDFEVFNDPSQSITDLSPICAIIENVSPQDNSLRGTWTGIGDPGFGFNDGCLTATSRSSADSNSWVYLKPVYLTAGTTYTISYDFGNDDTVRSERMKVAYGTIPSASAMTNLIFDHTSITGGTLNGTAQHKSVDFTPSATGGYYFGFNYYGTASGSSPFFLWIDNVSITKTLGVNETSKNDKALVIYPNPVKDILNVKLSKAGKATVRIYDTSGKLVLQNSISETDPSIDVHSLAKGTYTIQTSTEAEGTRSAKFIKE